MSSGFQVVGQSDAAPFTLRIHRGEGMALLAMNWKAPQPPADFVGFAIEYQEPGGDQFFVLQNRLGFAHGDDPPEGRWLPTTLAPIQKFRWVHFPRNAELSGEFVYRVTPVFMNERDELSYGEAQTASLELRRETYPGLLNVTFTRGFVSSQAFVDRYQSHGEISTLLPRSAKKGLAFQPTHPGAAEALDWMGFEARSAILEVLDQAIADPEAQVRLIAYDLNEPEIVSRLEQLNTRVRVIIDESGDHGEEGSAEDEAEARLVKSAGRDRVKRQQMGGLQHNKTIVVDGPGVHAVVWGSTNFSWRGFFVQSNNALVVRDKTAVALGAASFDAYWDHGDVDSFAATDAAKLTPLGLDGIDAQIAFSPHAADTALLAAIGEDIEGATSSVLYSLAFLAQTEGPIPKALTKVTADDAIFVYGISDRKAGGIDLQPSVGNPAPVYSEVLAGDAPEPFKSEPTGGSGTIGTRMHHKFVVIDFDKPTARVWMGSYNFSVPADTANGENLLLIKDRRIAVAYAIEALRIFDHYSFRVLRQDADDKGERLVLKRPPRDADELSWWDEDYTVPMKIRDREMFA
jgi:phosphatidylserine/phosphatidylglycerophosphate/cardiolipin synthase-like enzyme